jgi:hypothetical protein
VQRRHLKQQGNEHPSGDQIQQDMQGIIEANRDTHPEPGCNPHLLHPGEVLKLPNAGNDQAGPLQSAGFDAPRSKNATGKKDKTDTVFASLVTLFHTA